MMQPANEQTPDSAVWRVILAVGRVAFPLGGVVAVIGFVLTGTLHIEEGAYLYVLTLLLFSIKVPALVYESNRAARAAEVRRATEQAQMRAEVEQIVREQAQKDAQNGPTGELEGDRTV